jgi:diguanylate cyclase (GGDEF)-like protein
VAWIAQQYSAMGLFDHKKPPSSESSMELALGRSGMQLAQGNERRRKAVPKLWNDDEDDREPTGETNHVPASGRLSTFPHLMIMTGLAAGRLIPIGAGGLVVGRSRGSDVRVTDEGVSRQHCRVTRVGTAIVVEDLGSTNGTVVNGTKVLRAELAAGDRIQLGPDLIMQISLYDDAEQTLARKLFDASTRDPLTRAFNRQYFAQSLETELSYARRHDSSLSVMMLDIDGMRVVNDAHGQAAGDEVLRAVVELIGNVVRAEDVFCRYGGAQFAFVLREPVRSAARTAERLRMRIEAARITGAKKPVSVTVSIGVAEIGEPGAQLSSEGLVAVAEKRLHRAKLLGKNRVCAE